MSLSQQETNFLTHFSASGKRLIRFEDAEAFLHSRVAAVNTLGRLASKGWLQRLERGVYLIIPLEAGPERIWSENAFLVASQLISPGAIAYWSALRFWNWTEQLPQVMFIQTTQRKKPVVIQSMPYRFIYIQPKHFFGVTLRSLEGGPVSVTEPEKTLIDAAARPDLCGGIVHLAQVLKGNQQSIDWEKLNRYLHQWGGGTVVKRMGYLVERLALDVPEDMLFQWMSLLSKGISSLEPGARKTGTIMTRWQIQNNINL
jgi:predicted transcriptional regulator of viral defense system